MPEAKIKSEIDKALRAQGAWVYCPVPMGYGPRGIPDRLVCFPTIIQPYHVGRTLGIFAGIEAKAPPKVADNWQFRQLMNIQAASGIAGVVYSAEETLALISSKLAP